MPASQEGPGAREEVGGYEKRTPSLVLPHMNALVGARPFQCPCVPANDDMAEGHRLRAMTPGRQRSKRPPKERAVCFEHAVDNRDVATTQRRDGQYQADERRRPSPDIPEDPAHEPIMPRGVVRLVPARPLEQLPGDSFQNPDGCRPRLVRRTGAIPGPSRTPVGAVLDVVRDTPREHEALRPERIVEIIAPDAAMTAARVDHHAAPLVEADVGDEGLSRIGREKQQVAALQRLSRGIAEL